MPGGHAAFGGDGGFHFVHFEAYERVVEVAVGVVVGDEGAGFFDTAFGDKPGGFCQLGGFCLGKGGGKIDHLGLSGQKKTPQQTRPGQIIWIQSGRRHSRSRPCRALELKVP